MYFVTRAILFAFSILTLFPITQAVYASSHLPASLPPKNPFMPAATSKAATNISPSITPQQYTFSQSNSLHQFRLNYIQAKDVKEALQQLCPTGKIAEEQLSNTILFYGPNSEAQLIRSALDNIDIPSYQVTLEAKIISLNQEAGKNLGINWNWNVIPQRDENTSSTNSNYKGSFKFWRDYSFRFGATLNALESQGKAKILAKPRIITLPGKEASIFIGDHIPVQTEQHNSSGNYTSTEYLDAGIKLKYTPIVNKEGTMVTASVHTEVSTPSLIAEIKNYKITSRTADTHVRMQSGETLIIGGLINEEEQHTLQQIPFLSKLPILGNLFKNRNHNKTKTEVILVLTPYVTKAGESPAIYQASWDNLQEASPKLNS